MLKVKVTAVGNSMGILLPKEALAKLNAERGDSHYLMESPEGYTLTAYDPEFEELASAYAFGIARNHPFIDGNKRSAFVCGAPFLEINGLVVNAAEADTVIITESLAAGTIDKTQLAEWFRLNSE